MRTRYRTPRNMFDKVECTFLIVLVNVCVCGVNSYYFHEDQQPIYMTASVGGHIVMNCDVEFPQGISIPYMINWNHGGETIFSSYDGTTTATEPYAGRIELINNDSNRHYGQATINLTSIRETDNGWYECKILFPNRTPNSRDNGTWYYVTVNGGNLLAIPPVNQTVLEGEDAQFVCLSKDPNMKVQWYKDGIRLDEYHELIRRCSITDEGTLIIRPTDMGDYGEYECRAEEDDEVQTARAFLNVQYKAKVLFAPPEIHLPYGRPAVIDCHFRANPPLINLRWEKDGFLFDPFNIHGVFYRRNGSLYFSSVNEDHNGIYTCTPINELGTNGPSPPIRVIVQRPPVFVVAPHHLYLRKLGETLEIPCDARDGENGHRPIITWYRKDGNSLPTGRYSIKDGNLTIINIQDEDRGVYQCSATNKAATITAEAELLVENIPSSAPNNLTAVASPTSVHLSWQAGRQRKNVEYSVWYKPIELAEWRSYRVPTTRALEATITNLLPGKEYELMVLCKDENGDGLFSKSIRIFTQGSDGVTSPFINNNQFPPVGPPRNVSVHHKDVGYLVTWEAPEYGTENLRNYVVRWLQLPDNYLLGSVETTNMTVLINNLSEGNEYEVTVLSVSHDGQRTFSETVTIIIPGYKKIRAVSTGIVTGLAFLVCLTVAVYYARKKWCISRKEKEVLQNSAK